MSSTEFGGEVISKGDKFAELLGYVGRCERCGRMVGRTHVLSERNGSLDAAVVFVGEAPGRLGADRTGVPFSGDQSGRNFERLLQAAGFARSEVFITNAVLCNPRDDQGNNAPPRAQEIRHCAVHLRAVLQIIEPRVVAPLGRVALRALALVAPHTVDLRSQVGCPLPWAGRTLWPLYHPGPRAALWRSPVLQAEDFAQLGAWLRGGFGMESAAMGWILAGQIVKQVKGK